MKRWSREGLIKRLLLVNALTAILVVALITVFIFMEGLPLIRKYGFFNFILGRSWHPLDGVFGILPMVIGSVYVTLGAIILGVPLGLACAVFLAELAPKKAASVIRPAVELLAGIPSVVYGFYGLVVIVPVVRRYWGGTGLSVLSASIVLGVMILPTIINISEDAIRDVPLEYKEGSLALGASRWQTIKHIVLPAASPGIVTAVVLGMGRAIGETMAVILVAGNSAIIPGSIISQVRTMTANIAIEMGYAYGDHTQALYATGVVLFVSVMILNIITAMISAKAGDMS